MGEKLNWKRKDHTAPILCRDGKVPYLYFPLLEQAEEVCHGFSTRLGGVSSGCYSTMNFRLNSSDSMDNVKENFQRIADAIDFDINGLVLTHQTHTTNVRVVTEADAGKGILRERDYTDIDGLVTNVPGITLGTFYADCVPLYFYDPVKHAIGLSHSGWRGTVQRMGACTIAKMQQEYGSNPADILACVGPSICGDCYEVGEEVAEAFREAFGQETGKKKGIVNPGVRQGKYQLNLWKANEQVLLDAGILPKHLAVTNICTRCNSELLFSHRVMGSERGNLGAFLGLKEGK